MQQVVTRKFNSNKEREVYWAELMIQYTGIELDMAMEELKPDTKLVLCLRFGEGKDFNSIASLMKISITVVRNHHNMGIYKLYRHFNPRIIPANLLIQ